MLGFDTVMFGIFDLAAFYSMLKFIRSVLLPLLGVGWWSVDIFNTYFIPTPEF
jgi:hypothetical protein